MSKYDGWVEYDYKTVRFGVFRGEELVSPQYKRRYEATAFQFKNGGEIRRIEKDTLKRMRKIPVLPMEKMEQSW